MCQLQETRPHPSAHWNGCCQGRDGRSEEGRDCESVHFAAQMHAGRVLNPLLLEGDSEPETTFDTICRCLGLSIGHPGQCLAGAEFSKHFLQGPGGESERFYGPPASTAWTYSAMPDSHRSCLGNLCSWDQLQLFLGNLAEHLRASEHPALPACGL